jgi:hypothetical protein
LKVYLLGVKQTNGRRSEWYTVQCVFVHVQWLESRDLSRKSIMHYYLKLNSLDENLRIITAFIAVMLNYIYIYIYTYYITSHTVQSIATYNLFQWSTTTVSCALDDGCKWHPKHVE